MAKWSANGARILRYYIDFKHRSMALHRELSAPDLKSLQNKVDSLIEAWDRRYDEHLRKTQVAMGRSGADVATNEASHRIGKLSQILPNALSRQVLLDWESLKRTERYQARPFPEQRPKLIKSAGPEYEQPHISLFDVLLGKKRRKLEDAEAIHQVALRDWLRREQVVEDMHAKDMKAWESRRQAHDSAEATARTEFEQDQAEANATLDAVRVLLPEGDVEAVVEHVALVLDRSDYDDLFEKDYAVDYEGENKTLYVDYELPSPDAMPVVKSVKFSPTTGEIVETKISEREQKSNYDSTCYQIALRTLHELFGSDEFGNLQQISFNGYASSTDKATGRDVRPCILSLAVKRADFEAIELSRVDPKACFKSLKGVSASSLAALAPVPPVMQMNRADKRFVDAKDMSAAIDEGTNLASMSWEDFEHLVRQLFERIYASSGGEVRITQASRDGGVDAVAFDPDPIRGGKTVIQAKRYTRVVGVSAVRDLYGTLMNEGASKGILVTTADYGPDAYAFARGKPIVLISGPQLLHMLGEHGFKARIDIAEARKLFGTMSSEQY